MLRFSLRTLLLLVTATGIVSSVVAQRYFRKPPVIEVTTLPEWEALLKKHRKLILFVDCDWNIGVVLGRKQFADFSYWCRDRGDCVAVTFKIDANDPSNDVLIIANRLWESVDPPLRHAYKNANGAGRIAWISDGKIVETRIYSEESYLTAEDLEILTILTFGYSE